MLARTASLVIILGTCILPSVGVVGLAASAAAPTTYTCEAVQGDEESSSAIGIHCEPPSDDQASSGGKIQPGMVEGEGQKWECEKMDYKKLGTEGVVSGQKCKKGSTASE